MVNYKIDRIKNLEHLEDIPYTGYYWESDASAPKLLYEERFPKEVFINRPNPFCVEALLYSKEKGISIHIQHTGSYQVHGYDLANLPPETLDKTYLPHKLENVQAVHFKQVWEEKPIEENCDMMTLKPTALIFCGFKF